MLEKVSKKKLKAIADIIESYLPLFETMESGRHNASTLPLVYESGLNLLLKNSTLQPMMDKRNRLRNAKMVRAAKNLIVDFEDFGIKSYADFMDKILDGIGAVNGKSRLAPLKEKVIAVVSDKFQDYELECDAFYSSLLVDIFNQGRQHQTLTSKMQSIKKFAVFEMPESENFERITAHLKSELFAFLDHLAEEVDHTLEKSYKKNLEKYEILKKLQKQLSKYSFDVQEIFRKHCWQAYSFGNLYQLEKDGVKHIAWKTGHHIDDCLSCRAFETGEAVLQDADGKPLPHFKHLDGVMYNISDVSRLARLDGPGFFCHHDCRCAFIAAEKKSVV